MNNKGFTLIEILAVMIILGIIVAIAVPRIINLDQTAELQSLEMGVNELNSREKLLWSKYKIASTSYTDENLDIVIFSEMDISLNKKYNWNDHTLTFGSVTVTLERHPATNKFPAEWGGTDSKGKKYGWHRGVNNPHG
jgi:prepilin-type N-terminal cleavage/methylation domain-containing protein